MPCHVIAFRALTHHGASLSRLHQIHFPKSELMGAGNGPPFSTPLRMANSWPLGCTAFSRHPLPPMCRVLDAGSSCNTPHLRAESPPPGIVLCNTLAACACASSRRPLPVLLLQRAAEVVARIVALVAELLLDAHQLVVLARALAWLYR